MYHFHFADAAFFEEELACREASHSKKEILLINPYETLKNLCNSENGWTS